MPAWIEDIRNRLDVGAPRPWKWMDSLDDIWSASQKTVCHLHKGVGYETEDAELIANAPSDIAKLIQAVEVAEKALKRIANSQSYIDLEFRGAEFRMEARKALAKLQSGEFVESESLYALPDIIADLQGARKENVELKAELHGARYLIGCHERHIKDYDAAVESIRDKLPTAYRLIQDKFGDLTMVDLITQRNLLSEDAGEIRKGVLEEGES